MNNLARGLISLLGLLSFATALGLWFAMEGLLPNLGVAPNDLAGGLVGRATVRADMAGLFAGMGIAMLLAARHQSRAWTNAVLLFATTAISGRIISVVLDGGPAIVWPPVAIEGAVIALLLWYRSRLPAA